MQQMTKVKHKRNSLYVVLILGVRVSRVSINASQTDVKLNIEK